MSTSNKVKRALLIGIEYVDIGGDVQLSGCGHDIVDIYKYLTTELGYARENIVVLSDSVEIEDTSIITAKPTAQRIADEIIKLIQQNETTEEAWIHYSGHGASMADSNGDETDNLDEIIIPCDYNVAGVINDDLLRQLVNYIKYKLMMVFDCCHSGTICDLPYYYSIGQSSILNETVENNVELINPNIYQISGSRDDQTSLSLFSIEKEQYRGACTSSLLEIVRLDTNSSLTFRELIQKMNTWMITHNSHQCPAFAASARENIDKNVSSVFGYNKSLTITCESTQTLELELQQTQQELESCKAQLQQTQNVLQGTQNELADSLATIQTIQDEHETQTQGLRNRITNLEREIENTRRLHAREIERQRETIIQRMRNILANFFSSR